MHGRDGLLKNRAISSNMEKSRLHYSNTLSSLSLDYRGIRKEWAAMDVSIKYKPCDWHRNPGHGFATVFRERTLIAKNGVTVMVSFERTIVASKKISSYLHSFA